MLARAKNYLIIILAVIIAVFYAYLKIQQKIHQRQEDVTTTLEDNTLKVCEIADNLLTTKYRDKDGNVKVKRQYIPPEGKVTIKVDKGSTDVKVSVRDYGFCFTPGFSLSWYRQLAKSKMGTELVPAILFSPKIAYYRRYGLILNVNNKTGGIGISRHLDDTLFLWHPQNLEAFVSYHPLTFQKVLLIGEQKWFLGFRLSL